MDDNQNMITGKSLVAAAVIVAAMLISFLWIVKSEYRPIYGHYKTDVNVEMIGHDTLRSQKKVEMQQFANQVDSLKAEVEELRSHYQHDIDLMIYKTNQWLAFWLAFIGIVAGFFSVLNFYSHHRAKEEFKELESRNETRMESYGKRVNDYGKWVENYRNDIDQKVEMSKIKVLNYLKNMTHGLKKQIMEHKAQLDKNYDEHTRRLQTLDHNIDKAGDENRINTLMTCITSYPDPQMFSSPEDKKRHIHYFMERLDKNFGEYINSTSRAMRRNEYDETPLIVILTNMKASAIKSQPVFSDYHQNVTFQRFKTEVEDLTNKLIKKSIAVKDLPPCLQQIKTLLGQLTASIV